MVILDLDHPDIEDFIEWKAIEEDKARALINAGIHQTITAKHMLLCLVKTQITL